MPSSLEHKNILKGTVFTWAVWLVVIPQRSGPFSPTPVPETGSSDASMAVLSFSSKSLAEERSVPLTAHLLVHYTRLLVRLWDLKTLGFFLLWNSYNKISQLSASLCWGWGGGWKRLLPPAGNSGLTTYSQAWTPLTFNSACFCLPTIPVCVFPWSVIQQVSRGRETQAPKPQTRASFPPLSSCSPLHLLLSSFSLSSLTLFLSFSSFQPQY